MALKREPEAIASRSVIENGENTAHLLRTRPLWTTGIMPQTLAMLTTCSAKQTKMSAEPRVDCFLLTFLCVGKHKWYAQRRLLRCSVVQPAQHVRARQSRQHGDAPLRGWCRISSPRQMRSRQRVSEWRRGWSSACAVACNRFQRSSKAHAQRSSHERHKAKGAGRVLSERRSDSWQASIVGSAARRGQRFIRYKGQEKVAHLAKR